ncbi:MAG: hypothetical protein P4L43_05530 [Syntrophobacteraceae bacterium]|nr:hypothetical protein [Syntrophobacteraceae bacterium]
MRQARNLQNLRHKKNRRTPVMEAVANQPEAVGAPLLAKKPVEAETLS